MFLAPPFVARVENREAVGATEGNPSIRHCRVVGIELRSPAAPRGQYLGSRWGGLAIGGPEFGQRGCELLRVSAVLRGRGSLLRHHQYVLLPRVSHRFCVS
jgi:hypothetical protein